MKCRGPQPERRGRGRIRGEAAATKEPERTCAGCRRRAPREELLRFAVDTRGHLRVDVARRAPGRGVNLCPARGCLESALRQGFVRSLRRKIAAADPERFVVETRAALEEAARELEARALRDGRACTPPGVVNEPRTRRRLEQLRQQAGGLAAYNSGSEGVR